jgi:signal transduction histidine kinase
LVEAGVSRSIDAETQLSTCWIRIGDNGPGIPVDEQALIFEPFQRGKADRRFPQGMGLGLAIARDIVVAHDGDITLESSLGRGSRFTVTLPIGG